MPCFGADHTPERSSQGLPVTWVIIERAAPFGPLAAEFLATVVAEATALNRLLTPEYINLGYR